MDYLEGLFWKLVFSVYRHAALISHLKAEVFQSHVFTPSDPHNAVILGRSVA